MKIIKMDRIVEKKTITIKIMVIQMVTVFGLFFRYYLWRFFYYAK